MLCFITDSLHCVDELFLFSFRSFLGIMPLTTTEQWSPYGTAHFHIRPPVTVLRKTAGLIRARLQDPPVLFPVMSKTVTPTRVVLVTVMSKTAVPTRAVPSYEQDCNTHPCCSQLWARLQDPPMLFPVISKTAGTTVLFPVISKTAGTTVLFPVISKTTGPTRVVPSYEQDCRTHPCCSQL